MKNGHFLENGWINVRKCSGASSAKIVAIVKKHFSLKKIGHIGTLDLEAEGVLPLAIGEATKTIQYITNKYKIYRFFIKWGEETDTYDHVGKVIRTSDYRPNEMEIEKIITKYFTGNILQKPPKFSAIKIKGERAYNLARKNINFDIKEKKIFISYFKYVKSIENTITEFEVKCSSGTYIRSLANDLAIKMGTYGHTAKIIRIEDCFFKISDAIGLEKIKKVKKSELKNYLYPVDYVLNNLKNFEVEKKYSDLLKDGKIVYVDFLKKKLVDRNEFILIKCQGKLVSIANLQKGYIIPQRNFNN